MAENADSFLEKMIELASSSADLMEAMADILKTPHPEDMELFDIVGIKAVMMSAIINILDPSGPLVKDISREICRRLEARGKAKFIEAKTAFNLENN